MPHDDSAMPFAKACPLHVQKTGRKDGEKEQVGASIECIPGYGAAGRGLLEPTVAARGAGA